MDPRPARVSPAEALTPGALLDLYRPDITEVLAVQDAPAYRHAQVCEHLFARPLAPFSDATSLPLELRAALDERGASLLTVVEERAAPDGTTKFLFETRSGALVEAVRMRYGNRATACLSSQSGCPVGCVFCATGAVGLKSNLSASEIVDQARTVRAHSASEGLRLSNVVYMGMGEPLLNVRSVLDSIRIITSPSGLGLSHRSVSVSTVGIPAGILALARAEPQVNLALSLHAADDPTRALLIPSGFRHPISEILRASWDHFAITGRKLLVEYVLLRGVNDSPDDARRLVSLLKGHVLAVNLLPWNPVRVPKPHDSRLPASFSAPSASTIAAFREVLLNAHVDAVVRRSKGVGIDAACGQLAGRHGV